MAEEVGYNSRVRVQAGAALPGVSADSFGAGVGQAVAQVGAVVQQEQLENARLDRQLRDNAEWSAYLVSEAQAREEMSAIARDGRLSDQPGHSARIAAELQKREEALLGTLSSERLRQQGRARVAEWGGSLRTREADYEFVRGQEIALDAFAEQRGIAEGRVRRLDKPDDYKIELKLQVDAINALNTSDKVKQQLIDETEQRFGVAFIRGMTDRDPLAAKALIDSGAFDGIITDDQTEVLRNGAEVEIRRLEAQREREQAEALRNVRTQIGTFRQAESMGLVQDDAAYDQAITAAQAVGDEKLVLELVGLKANNAFTKVWGPSNATAVQREQRLAELNRIAAPTPEQALEREFLRKNNPGWASQEREDPVGQSIARGGQGAPPPVDFTDAGSIAQRGQWAQARGVPAFSKTEAAELGRIYDTGRAGEEQVMGVLSQLPTAVAMRTAREIEPNDRTLPYVVTLAPSLRNMARRGREVLRANPKALADPMREDMDLTEAIEGHNRAFDKALAFVPPEQRAALKEVAKQLAAGQGDKVGEPINEQRWSTALKLALGGQWDGRVWRGGYDYWAEQPFLLPSGLTKEEFKRAAIGYSEGASDYPANPDGSRANLYRAHPVAVRPGVYQFHTARGGVIRTKSGRVFEVPIGGSE